MTNFKQCILVLIVMVLIAPWACADFPSDVVILNNKDIVKLTNDQLTEAYINTLVEIEADRAFHTTSGFSAKEFKNYKALLRYRMFLLMEIQNRNLKLPQF